MPGCGVAVGFEGKRCQIGDIREQVATGVDEEVTWASQSALLSLKYSRSSSCLRWEAFNSLRRESVLSVPGTLA